MNTANLIQAMQIMHISVHIRYTEDYYLLPASFFFIFVFSIKLTVNNCSINFADDWIRTVDLWYQKRPLYQLSHNHWPLRTIIN